MSNEFDHERIFEEICEGRVSAINQADREIRMLREENRKLREAVIRERAVQSMMRRECVHAYDGVTPSKGCKDNAEKELRAEGVIE